MLKKGGDFFHFIGWKLKHKMVSSLTQTPVISMGCGQTLGLWCSTCPVQAGQCKGLARWGNNAGGSAEYGIRQQGHC